MICRNNSNGRLVQLSQIKPVVGQKIWIELDLATMQRKEIDLKDLRKYTPLQVV